VNNPVGAKQARPESPGPEFADDGTATCPIDVRFAIADPPERTKTRLVIEDNPTVVSAVAGIVMEVKTDEISGWARVTIRSTDLTLSYRFYLDSARDSLPTEGMAVTAGDVIGGAHELLDLEVEQTGEEDTASMARLLDAWGCRQGLPSIEVLSANLLDGSKWEVRFAQPIEAIGNEKAMGYGEVQMDGEPVAGAYLIGERPDFDRPDFPGFDPPRLLDEFPLPNGRTAQHWNLAPSHENDTSAYALWIEGPGEHMYLSSGQPIQDAALIAESLRMDEDGDHIESVWFGSKRVALVNLTAYFFLMDASAPLRRPEVRINTTCRIENQDSSCQEAELEIPTFTPGTRDAFEGATLVRVRT
jgi:hypothetical protein